VLRLQTPSSPPARLRAVQVMSPGLQRARAPFRVKNALTGTAIGSVAVGIYYYSMSAVRQETFDDLDAEARALARPGAGAETAGLAPEGAFASGTGGASAGIVTAGASLAPLATGITPVGAVARQPSAAPVLARGVLPRVVPQVLDPVRKTLVWGAPSVDAPGKLGDRAQPR
jgi:cytochrome c oxidase assembly factor 3